jgi:hypothetical protein
MVELTDILQKATRLVAANFFHLPIAGGNPVYRERVYCYELYHQMRTLWPKACPFCLNGEVDKRGHVLMGQFGAADNIPDLLVHGPGDMKQNHAIIEIKKCELTKEGIQKDVKTFATFLSEGVGYERGIYLVFGDQIADDRRQQMREEVVRVRPRQPIELWHHARVGESAAQIELLRVV